MSARRKMGQTGVRPLAVLVDRSRDWMAADGLIGLEPDDLYHTTDNRMPLRARTLASYDVLVIAGQGSVPYTEPEQAAITGFVRRGGGLLLAATAGVFERYAGRPVEEMAACAVARRFGIEFLSPHQGARKPKVGPFLVSGYPPESVRVHAAPPFKDIRRYDVHLDPWSPVQATGKCTPLLSHRGTGEAAALALQPGKGRVVAVGNAGFLGDGSRLCRALIDYLADRRPRGPGRQLPYEIVEPLRTSRIGRIRIRYPESVADKVPAVRRIAGRVVPYLEAAIPVKKKPEKKAQPQREKPFELALMPSCSFGAWGGRWVTGRVGAHVSEPEIAFALGACVGMTLVERSAFLWPLWGTVLGYTALVCRLGLAAMRAAGFEDEAERLGARFETESRRRMRGVDAGRYYEVEADYDPGFWLWRELERQFGEDILARLSRTLPQKLGWGAGGDELFSPLDITVYFLSRAVRRDLYPWFAERGATVHPLPLSRFESKEFNKGVERYLRGLIADAGAPVSERLHAVQSLTGRLRKQKRTLSYAARQLRAPEPARRLAAAAWLAAARDARAAAALQALADRKDDPGLAGIAALLLVEQGDQQAADRLVELARGLDHCFQLDASAALSRVGDPRSEQLSLQAIGRAHGRRVGGLEIRYDPQVRVWCRVDGRRVANVFSWDRVAHMPANTHFSIYYVGWVHTRPEFRRKGLARQAFQRALDDPRARRCSCAGLGTGTGNFAHALYRDFGMVDAPVWDYLTCELEGAAGPGPASGVRVRAYRPGDDVAMSRLYNACYGESSALSLRRPARRHDDAVRMLAYRGRRLVAYAVAHRGDESATIGDLAWDPKDKKHAQSVRYLVGKLHGRLKKAGVKRMDAHSAPGVLGPLLEPLGYTSTKAGGLDMIAVLDLPQFLGEIRPLLEKRLANDAWVGTITLCGEKLKAALEIRRGRVRVLRRLPTHPTITLRGPDDSITRIVTGIETPFKVYWELNLQIEPPLNQDAREFLDKVFPQAKICRWAWG